jgi:hypothetical protein
MRIAPGVLATLLLAAPVLADTYEVGPGKPHTQIAGNDVLERELEPGDIVLVTGNQTYDGDIILRSNGTKANPIVFRGVLVDGKRPVLSGGDYTIVVDGDHVVLENLEVTAGAEQCVNHKGDDLTLRNVVVHDCPNHGILSHDDEAGDLLIEYSEIYRCGNGDQKHQLYLTANSDEYPNATFRLQHSYIHDGNGGNNVKSRHRRNEIYYNWIEGPEYHVLDLIGSDNGTGYAPPQENSDVVGNVLWQKGTEGVVARMGGDATGATGGCYRFAYNTILSTGDLDYVFRAQDEIGSIGLYGNVIYGSKASGVNLVSTSAAEWVHGDNLIVGADNWIRDGWTLSGTMTDSVRGTAPGVMDLAGADFRPVEGSDLLDTVATNTVGPAGCQVPGSLSFPAFLPPARKLEAVGSATPRGAANGTYDIGAFELGLGEVPGETLPDAGAGPGSSPDARPGTAPDGGGPGAETGGGGGCAIGGGGAGGLLGLAVMVALALLVTRRR